MHWKLSVSLILWYKTQNKSHQIIYLSFFSGNNKCIDYLRLSTFLPHFYIYYYFLFHMLKAIFWNMRRCLCPNKRKKLSEFITHHWRLNNVVLCKNGKLHCPDQLKRIRVSNSTESGNSLDSGPEQKTVKKMLKTDTTLNIALIQDGNA